jgi:hypothetical protein
MPRRFIIYPHNQSVMAPTQFAAQCLSFFKIRPNQVKLSEIAEIGIRKTLKTNKKNHAYSG